MIRFRENGDTFVNLSFNPSNKQHNKTQLASVLRTLATKSVFINQLSRSSKMRSSFISSFAAFTGLALATPSIVVVPGAWQISPSWTPFINLLKGAGYETSLVTLPSVGISLTGLDVDVAAAQAVIDPLLDAGKEVVVLCHSLGGLIAANSVGNRSIAARSAAGSPGGVVQLIYLAAFMAPEGYSLYNLMGNAWFEWMEVAVSQPLVDMPVSRTVRADDVNRTARLPETPPRCTTSDSTT